METPFKGCGFKTGGYCLSVKHCLSIYNHSFMHRGINKIISGIQNWLLVNGVRSEVNFSFQSPHRQKTSLNLLIKSTLSKKFCYYTKMDCMSSCWLIFAFGLVLFFGWEFRFNPFGQRSACLRSIGF